jgi:hypothetical protein
MCLGCRREMRAEGETLPARGEERRGRTRPALEEEMRHAQSQTTRLGGVALPGHQRSVRLSVGTPRHPATKDRFA